MLIHNTFISYKCYNTDIKEKRTLYLNITVTVYVSLVHTYLFFQSTKPEPSIKPEEEKELTKEEKDIQVLFALVQHYNAQL